MDITLLIATSLHIGSFEGEYNSIHPHIRLQDDSYISGAYYNSESAISLYAGFEYEIKEDLNVEYGIVSGYSDTDIMPFVRVKYKNIYLAPGVEQGELVGFVMGLEKSF